MDRAHARYSADVLQMLLSTFAAALKGLFTMATGRGPQSQAELKPGDVAPDFSLRGSDGQVYRLQDLLGDGPIAVAWFPKAFTGG
jgi:peroxiredoxin Q/BCP